jgi:diguanylate cyclase (GGDEF)-like protein
LKRSLYKDELTGVYNRKWLHENILNKQKRFINGGILALVDLNYFKQINDAHGHIIGDKVLIFIANQLKKIKGTVARYGGDEFIILFNKNISIYTASKQLHNIREDILKKHFNAKNSSFRVSFSYGLAEYKTDDDLATTIENADQQMYDDKIKFKTRVRGIEII